MTIIKTYEVTCDWPDCHESIEGAVAQAGNSSHAANDARKTARRKGWRRSFGLAGALGDWCPRHAEDLRRRAEPGRAER